jgi:hypothetical protein
MEHEVYMVSADAKLYRVDRASGSAGFWGNIGIPNVTDIAFQGPTLWGLTFGQFLRIDPHTGTGAVIGNTGFGDLNGLAVSNKGAIYSAGFAESLLTRIDPVTGAVSTVGVMGPYTSNGDLAFDSNDKLYATLTSGASVVLATIDTATGAAHVVGPTGFAAVYGLTFCGDRLYGATEAGQVLEISCATGAGRVIGTNGIQQWGLATRNC